MELIGCIISAVLGLFILGLLLRALLELYLALIEILLGLLDLCEFLCGQVYKFFIWMTRKRAR